METPRPSPEPAPTAAAAPRDGAFDALLADVPLEIAVELGRVKLSLREIGARLAPGSIITLTKLTGDRLDIRVNDRLVARGEAVAVGDRYGVRVVELVSTTTGEP
jgi:flagellar motor switch protein FliN